jgi:hypothetical protein
MSGFEVQLLTGIAHLLADANLGTWRDTGVYTAAETGIVFATVPATPDQVITLTPYGVSDDPTLSDSVIGVQVRTRWAGQDPRPVMDLDGSIFNVLHGLEGVTLTGGVRVVSCFRRIGPISMGIDTNNRWMWSSSYYATVHRPSQNRS